MINDLMAHTLPLLPLHQLLLMLLMMDHCIQECYKTHEVKINPNPGRVSYFGEGAFVTKFS